MSYNKPIRRIAIVGTGVIGAKLGRTVLARGFDVVATNPGPNAEENLRKYVDEAWEILTALGLAPGAIAAPPELHKEHEGGACECRLRSGERSREAGFQDQALRRDG